MITLKLGKYFIAAGKQSDVCDPNHVKCVFNMEKKIYNRILKLAMMAGVNVEQWVDMAIGRVVEGTEDAYHKEMTDQLSHLFGDNELP